MACKHNILRDTLHVLTDGDNSTHAWSADTHLYQSHEHAVFVHATQFDMRCGDLPPWRRAVHTKLSFCVAFEGVWLTRNLRGVRLTPRVSWVWSCITNIWIYSREGGGISNYRAYISGSFMLKVGYGWIFSPYSILLPSIFLYFSFLKAYGYRPMEHWSLSGWWRSKGEGPCETDLTPSFKMDVSWREHK